MSTIFSTKIHVYLSPDVNAVQHDLRIKRKCERDDGGGGGISSNRQDETERAGRIDLVARRRGFLVHVRFRFQLPLPFDRY